MIYKMPCPLQARILSLRVKCHCFTWKISPCLLAMATTRRKRKRRPCTFRRANWSRITRDCTRQWVNYRKSKSPSSLQSWSKWSVLGGMIRNYKTSFLFRPRRVHTVPRSAYKMAARSFLHLYWDNEMLYSKALVDEFNREAFFYSYTANDTCGS